MLLAFVNSLRQLKPLAPTPRHALCFPLAVFLFLIFHSQAKLHKHRAWGSFGALTKEHIAAISDHCDAVVKEPGGRATLATIQELLKTRFQLEVTSDQIRFTPSLPPFSSQFLRGTP